MLLYTTVVAFIKSLSDVSQQLLLVIDKKQKLTSVITRFIEKCNVRNSADVELAVYGSLKKLVNDIGVCVKPLFIKIFLIHLSTEFSFNIFYFCN
jgi:hypothetical protein